MIGSLSYTSKDQLGKDFKEPLGDISLDISERASDRVAQAQKIDAFARAVCNLTTNTYQDSFVEYSYSVTEVIQEGD